MNAEDQAPTEMHLRVRDAIAKALDPLIEPGRTTTLNELADGCARAAIEAMREPTEAMVIAGCKALQHIPRSSFMAAELSGSPHATARLKMPIRWNAMIDAALGRKA